MTDKPDVPDEDPVPFDADDPEDGQAGRGFIPDGVKKALLAGMGALFMTEEGARRMARDWKLPKELVGFLGQQVTSAKDELLRVLTDEIHRFLESDAVRRELMNALESMTLEVQAEVRFRRDPEGTPRPTVKASIRPAGRRKGRR